MRRLLTIILLVSAMWSPVRAQNTGSPEALQAANELFAILATQTIKQMSAAMIAQIWPRLEQEVAGKIDSPTMTELRAELERSMTNFVTDAMTSAPAIYARNFTAAELRDMAAFYRTPTGVKALQQLPSVTAEVTGLIMPRLPVFQQELAAGIQGILSKHGYKN